MTIAADAEKWFDAVAGVFADMPGLKATFAGGRWAPDSDVDAINLVQPMIDEELLAAPAAVFGYGGAEVLTNNWESTKHTIEAAIWIEKHPVATSYAECIAWIDKVRAAVPEHAAAYLQDSRLKSLVLMTFGRITPRTWPEGSDRDYLTLPFTLEVQLRQATRHKPE